MAKPYRVIGLMSGSSLDGLDIAYCHFEKPDDSWRYQIIAADTVQYPDDWVAELRQLTSVDAKRLWESHVRLGHYFGGTVQGFIRKYQLENQIDLIASHGHTVFHFPEKKLTVQIGDGAALSAVINLPVVCDFRTTDIALGGQGTPIVPIGDLLLFKAYRFCLNIGGISNISCKTADSIVAFDICPANQILNRLAADFGKAYDDDGKMAASGKVNAELLEQLNAIPYYKQAYPKSLDNSFSQKTVWPLIEKVGLSTADKLATYTEHIAQQVSRQIQIIAEKENIHFTSSDKILVTGGGAFNTYLIQRMAAHTALQIVVPEKEIIQFKEALVIGLMGVLRLRNEANVLCSVTGASADSIGGAIYLS